MRVPAIAAPAAQRPEGRTNASIANEVGSLFQGVAEFSALAAELQQLHEPSRQHRVLLAQLSGQESSENYPALIEGVPTAR